MKLIATIDKQLFLLGLAEMEIVEKISWEENLVTLNNGKIIPIGRFYETVMSHARERIKQC